MIITELSFTHKDVSSPLSNVKNFLLDRSTVGMTIKERMTILEHESKYRGSGVQMVILVGPPAVGKTQILRSISAQGDVNILPLISTRQAVPGEGVSIDRTFIAPEEFNLMKERNELLAISTKSGVQGKYHMAVRKDTLRNLLQDNRPAIIDKTFAGWTKLLSEIDYDPSLAPVKNKILASHQFIFLLPPSMLTLIRRLAHRNRMANSQPSREERREELKRAKEFEMLLNDSLFPNISYIVNDDINRVITEIRRILSKP